MPSSITSFWSRKSVLITGASSGLGWALTEALAPYNIHFCLLARREVEMRQLAEKLHSSGSRFWIRACDVRDRGAVERVVKDFANASGRLDAAWVNSGIGGETSRRKWDWDFVERMIDTNLKGALYTSRVCLELMAQQKHGALAGICSAASLRGMPARGIYSATKIALAYYLEAVAPEYPELQITVIHPGFVDTPINRGNPNRIFLMTSERAAEIMIRAVARGKRKCIYPWQMNLIYRVVQALPDGIWHPLAKRLVHVAQTGSIRAKQR